MNLYGKQGDVKAFAGSLYGMNPKSIISYPAKFDCDFGKGLFVMDGKVANEKFNNHAVLDISGYTTASKDIIAKVNGVTIPTLTTTGTIATDAATLAVSINENVDGVTASATSANKVAIVSDSDKGVTATLSYDGSDVTESKVSYTSDYTYCGVAVFHQVSYVHCRGMYPKGEIVGCVNDGAIWVTLANSVTPTDCANAYVKADGTFTTESSGNTLAGKFRGSVSDGLAIVDLNK